MNKQMGRPSIYSPELAMEICSTIMISRSGIRVLQRKHSHWPSPSTIYSWLKTYPDFSEYYARAREIQFDMLFDEIIEIADNCYSGEGHGEREAVDNLEAIERARLMIDARKWMIEHLAPKVHATKTSIYQVELDPINKILVLARESRKRATPADYELKQR